MQRVIVLHEAQDTARRSAGLARGNVSCVNVAVGARYKERGPGREAVFESQLALETQMAAVLHDVMEDCGVTRALLAHEGFPTAVIDAVEALSKKIVDGAEEPYEEFIRHAAQNPIARRVKPADLEDNMDLSRIAAPTAKDFARVEKYRSAKAVIERAIAGDA